MARNPRVIVIAPEPVSRDEIQKMLALSGFAVLGEAGYGIEAVSLAKKTEPDVVVIAIEEPLIRALQTVEAMADLLPQSPIIGYSSIKDSASMRKAMVAGVKDYLSAPVKEEELINSIHTVMAQEERRRARLSGEMDEPIAAGTVITVFGAKGGIGKTTIATNLATALVQKTKQSVVVVDLDTRFGDVAILMDIPVERSIADLAMPEEEITREVAEECVYTHNTGVVILPAPIRPTDWRNVHAGHIERVVQLLMQTHDYVILDTPGTFNDIVARALEMATMVVLVCTVDMASLKDTLLAIDMLRSWNFPSTRRTRPATYSRPKFGACLAAKFSGPSRMTAISARPPSSVCPSWLPSRSPKQPKALLRWPTPSAASASDRKHRNPEMRRRAAF